MRNTLYDVIECHAEVVLIYKCDRQGAILVKHFACQQKNNGKVIFKLLGGIMGRNKIFLEGFYWRQIKVRCFLQ